MDRELELLPKALLARSKKTEKPLPAGDLANLDTLFDFSYRSGRRTIDSLYRLCCK